MAQVNNLVCWCGNDQLKPFSGDYLLCDRCKTLVLGMQVAEDVSSGLDEKSLYGKSYWLEHQVQDLGFPDIFTRTRKDLPQRCVHWIKTFLKYKIPPGSTLELGSSHGGFVAMLQWIGFDAVGLELSPWVVDYSKDAFQIPVFLGKIEDQTIEPRSLDAVILMDVLEHLPDPIKTISHIVTLLKQDGILMIQTPCFPLEKTYEELKSTNNPFLTHLAPPEHIYLFSLRSVQQFLVSIGLSSFSFEPAFFNQYDMFLVASRSALTIHTQEEIDKSLLTSPGGRLILALLDKASEVNLLQEQWAAADMDRTARLEQIHQFKAMLEESEADRAARYEQIEQYKGWLQESEQDRAARWELIQQYEARLKEVEQNYDALLSEMSELKKNFFVSISEKFKTIISSRSGK